MQECQAVARDLMEGQDDVSLDCDSFIQLIAPQALLFLAAFSEELVVPDWSSFTTDMTYHFDKVKHNEEGENAQYIPILKNANAQRWGLSICSIDGQRFSIGDSDVPFSIQSVSKPVTYGLCLEQEGEEEVDRWIGVEPAGRPFNTQDLDVETQTPFNASVNSGAIMAAGLYTSQFPESTWNECVDKIRQTWSDLSGNDLEVGFSRETYDSEKETAYNNFAIAYNLKGRRGLPRDVCLQKMLDVYLGCCSIEMTAECLAVAAATLANGGVCPITRKEVFSADVVRHVLAETMTCGMYNQAGRFAVEVGVPAKSGVSGALMVIVPNVFGLATFSPRLNRQGNSVRGLEFCKGLVGSYRVHIFEPLRSGNDAAKIDPRLNGKKNVRSEISQVALAYDVGDPWGKALRDIFIHTLVHVGCAAGEGLSTRMRKAIRDEYQLVYQHPMDEASLQLVIDMVEPGDLSHIDTLKDGRFIDDDFRSMIGFAILEILNLDNTITEREKKVIVDLTTFLGMDREVVLMKLSRYQHHVDPRLKESEPFEGGEQLKASLTMSSSSPALLSLQALIIDENNETKTGSESVEADVEESEVHRLRREVYHLRRQVGTLTRLLQQSKDRNAPEQTHHPPPLPTRLSIRHSVTE